LINQRGDVTPDLWLPAVPTDRQNANVYDAEWREILEDIDSLRRPE
jgi:hypothetical protein